MGPPDIQSPQWAPRPPWPPPAPRLSADRAETGRNPSKHALLDAGAPGPLQPVNPHNPAPSELSFDCSATSGLGVEPVPIRAGAALKIPPSANSSSFSHHQRSSEISRISSLAGDDPFIVHRIRRV